MRTLPSTQKSRLYLPQLQPVKNKNDPRHLRRIENMQAVYAYIFGNNKLQSPDLDKIISHIKKIDQIIKKGAPKWPLDKINRVDLSILRTAIWELLYQKKTPPKVVIDEAVELAKEFGSQTSHSFVNGVLGSTVKKLKIITTNCHKNDQNTPATSKKTGSKIQTT